MPDLFQLTKSFEAPENLGDIVNTAVEELREEKSATESEFSRTTVVSEDIISNISSKLQSIKNDFRKGIEQLENKLEQKKKQIYQLDETKNLVQRKVNDSITSWNEILQGLPSGIIDATSTDIAELILKK